MSKSGQPALPRYGHSSVWTGKKLIVWGGMVGNPEAPSPAASGGVYDAASDAWGATPAVGAPSARSGHTAVWTGDRMIVWGGRGSDAISLGDGFAYFPDSGRWSPISSQGAPTPRAGHTAVWTGSEMLVWGGGSAGNGGAYDPVSDTWRPISVAGAPSPRLGHGAVWTGKQMAIWGGSIANSGGDAEGIGAFYDPVADSWVPIASQNAPSGGYGDWEADGERAVQLFWTGENLVSFVVNPAFLDDGPRAFWTEGGIYDPASGTWQAISTAGSPDVRPYFGAWTGSGLYICGSSSSSFRGSLYDSVANRWTVQDSKSTGSFQGRAGVWAPELGELLVFGGMWATGTGQPDWSGGDAGQRGFRIKVAPDSVSASGVSLKLLPPQRTVTAGKPAKLVVMVTADSTVPQSVLVTFSSSNPAVVAPAAVTVSVPAKKNPKQKAKSGRAKLTVPIPASASGPVEIVASVPGGSTATCNLTIKPRKN